MVREKMSRLALSVPNQCVPSGAVDAGPLVWIASLDLEFVGFAVVGLFALTWAVAVAVWRFGHIEERWMPENG